MFDLSHWPFAFGCCFWWSNCFFINLFHCMHSTLNNVPVIIDNQNNNKKNHIYSHGGGEQWKNLFALLLCVYVFQFCFGKFEKNGLSRLGLWLLLSSTPTTLTFIVVIVVWNKTITTTTTTTVIHGAKIIKWIGFKLINKKKVAKTISKSWENFDIHPYWKGWKEN